jgi:hypothetical protein
VLDQVPAGAEMSVVHVVPVGDQPLHQPGQVTVDRGSPKTRCPIVMGLPCRGAPFRAENDLRPPVDVGFPWPWRPLNSRAPGAALWAVPCRLEHED